MGTPNAMEVPGPVMAVLRDYLHKHQVGDLLAITRPLTEQERSELDSSLQAWQAEYYAARDKVRAITARLMRP